MGCRVADWEAEDDEKIGFVGILSIVIVLKREKFVGLGEKDEVFGASRTAQLGERGMVKENKRKEREFDMGCLR